MKPLKFDLYTIVNANIFDGQHWINTNVSVKHDKILALGDQLIGQLINIPVGTILIPGLIDLHAHARDFDEAAQETAQSIGNAALTGGYQLICTMANTKPCLDNIDQIQQWALKCQQSIVPIKTFGAVTINLAGEKLTNLQACHDQVVGYSDDGHNIDNGQLLKQAFEQLAHTDKIISLHCQSMLLPEQTLINDQTLGYEGLHPQWEANAIKCYEPLLPFIKSPCHFAHLSTQPSINLIKAYRAINQYITCEVTPHHLLWSANDITTNDGIWKVNPPLWAPTQRIALIKAINEGIIDVIASDHAPHLHSDKQVTFDLAKPGFIWYPFLFPVLYTKLVLHKLISLEKLINLLTFNPAKILKLAIALQVNAIANFVIIDLHTIKTINIDHNLSKATNSPLWGTKAQGWPIYNIIKGKMYAL